MEFSELKVNTGARIQLTLSGQNYKSYRCEAVLVGFRDNRSIIISIINKPPQVLLYEGLTADVTIVQPLGIIRLETTIDTLCESPFPYIHLEYPRDIKFDQLRKFPRFNYDRKLSIVAKTDLGVSTAKMEGCFCNISQEGAKLALAKELSNVVTKLAIESMVDIAGEPHKLEINGDIKRTFGREDQFPKYPFAYGVSFDLEDSYTRMSLLALCYELQVEKLMPGK